MNANARQWLAGLVLALGGIVSAARAIPVDLSLRGVVRDEAGHPLAGVTVKTFVDGFLRASVVSAEDGAYAVSWSGEAGEDPTIVVWWLSPTPGEVPEVAVLREGEQARALGLWGPCIPRLAARPDTAYDVVLYGEAEKLRLLSEADCMKTAAP